MLLIVLLSFSTYAQDMKDYTSNWEGKIESSRTFNIKVEIENLGLEKARFKISNNKSIIDYPFDSKSTSILKIPFAENHSFEGVLSENEKEINGFIKSGLLLYHLKLTLSNRNSFVGVWNILMVDKLKSEKFYLSLENGSGNNYEAYPFFGDNTFTGTWCTNFQKENDSLFFEDFKTGLKFKGKLLPQKINLGIYIGDGLVSQIDLKKSNTDWEIGLFDTIKIDKITGNLQFEEMEKLIAKDSFPNTHSVLISRKGELIYENYFDGYNSNIPHQMKSASKSISSAIVGIAKDKSLFINVEQSIFDFLPKKYQTYKDSLKSKINLESLLTMSSGIDAVDYGINANAESPAVEDNFQMTKDWTETILNSKMINRPNTKANYGSANPYLLGVAIDSIVSESLALFIDKNLFQPLKISNYVIQSDLKGKPYFGGGMYLTPKDMLKFGELYLGKGKWESKRILSKKWIKNSFKNYRNLENVQEKNGYGYLWWHNTYETKRKRIKSIEARGNGGQYIFVLPSLKTVVVITAGNYRNGKTQQPEMVFEKYILPYLEN